MMKRLILLSVLILSATLFITSCGEKDPGGSPGPDPKPPVDTVLVKKEMRAVWFTTVWGNDWPKIGANSNLDNVEVQKQRFIEYLDKFVECNVNTVFVQIRGMADALYQSPYEPWNKWVTNNRETGPGYDVLKFMIDETHKRGIEFHAWINPLRVSTNGVVDPMINKDWLKVGSTSSGSLTYYSPAIPEARQRVFDIIDDIITKYDVDGVHFDDYFYPQSSKGSGLSDQDEYLKYGQGYATIQEFRRDNVNKVVKGVRDLIVAKKPGILFSISPASNNVTNYEDLFADVEKWCKEGWLDIVIPQLYHGTQQKLESMKFFNRMVYWGKSNYKATLVIGYGLYRFGDPTVYASDPGFAYATELDAQFKVASQWVKVGGSVMYTAINFFENKVGVIDALKLQYKDPAVVPFMGRKTVADPVTPTNVVVSGTALSWNAGNDLRSVVYRKDGEKWRVVKITTEKSLTIKDKGAYCVSTINKDNLESKPSITVTY